MMRRRGENEKRRKISKKTREHFSNRMETPNIHYSDRLEKKKIPIFGREFEKRNKTINARTEELSTEKKEVLSKYNDKI